MAPVLLRIRTKDGTERFQADAGTTLADLKQQIAQAFSVPLDQQVLSRSEQTGPVPRKGATFASTEDSSSLAALGVSSGTLLFLDYQVDRENQAQYQEKDPFKTLVQEGELRKAGTSQWTLSNFLDYRSTKEFVIEAPPEPHCKFVQVDPSAAQGLINFMIAIDFQSKRLGILYGKWTEDAEGQPGVEVHAVYEPSQDSSSDEITLLDDAEGEERIAALSQMLGLSRVGVMIAHPAREYAFSVNEIRLAAKLHAQVLAAEPEKGKRFVTMKARPVLKDEEIEGVATMEAYQLTDQCVALCERDAFSQSSTDPRVAKTPKDCCFVVEKKEQRKATMESFVARVFDIARPFNSFLGTGFAIENRPTEPQTTDRMADYLRARRSRREPFLRSISDLHLLLFLCNLLDVTVDMPVLCSKVVMQQSDELEGFQMMVNCYAGIE